MFQITNIDNKDTELLNRLVGDVMLQSTIDFLTQLVFSKWQEKDSQNIK